MRTLVVIVGTAFLTFGGIALFVRALFNALDSIDYEWDEYDRK
jgi:hypothetical protein